MFRIISTGNSTPMQWPVSPDAVFESGSAATLTVLGSQIFVTPSTGMSFIGVFDDVKTKAFSAVSWDEEVETGVISPAALTLNGSNQVVTAVDIKIELANPNVDGNYFISNPVPVQLIPRNGVVVFPAGTLCNLDLGGTGTPNAIKTLVRYPYQIPNVVGDDTTFGSQMATVWIERILFETSEFEVNQQYNVMSNLFINEKGLFTTRQIFPNSPVVAICTAPPSRLSQNLQALLL
jgi:hypothetical protein